MSPRSRSPNEVVERDVDDFRCDLALGRSLNEDSRDDLRTLVDVLGSRCVLYRASLWSPSRDAYNAVARFNLISGAPPTILTIEHGATTDSIRAQR